MYKALDYPTTGSFVAAAVSALSQLVAIAEPGELEEGLVRESALFCRKVPQTIENSGCSLQTSLAKGAAIVFEVLVP